MDLPPDVEIVNAQSSGYEINVAPSSFDEYDSVDPEFIAWAEEEGINLGQDNAEQLIRAYTTRPEGTPPSNSASLEDYMGGVMANGLSDTWYTLNYSLYKTRKEGGFPPVNPDPEDGAYTRDVAQQKIDEMQQAFREMKARRRAVQVQQDAN